MEPFSLLLAAALAIAAAVAIAFWPPGEAGRHGGTQGGDGRGGRGRRSKHEGRGLTNLASNYDEAFIRRILAHIKFELPDLDCRTRLWTQTLPERLPRAVDVTPEWLAAESEGLSGGVMLNALIDAASVAVARRGANRRIHGVHHAGRFREARHATICTCQ